MWHSVNGERLGTLNGHTGAVWCIDVNCILSIVDNMVVRNMENVFVIKMLTECYSPIHIAVI